MNKFYKTETNIMSVVISFETGLDPCNIARCMGQAFRQTNGWPSGQTIQGNTIYQMGESEEKETQVNKKKIN